MQGDRDIIAALNGILRNELTAINQDFLHSRMLNHWGLGKLGKLRIGADTGEIQKCDLGLENDGIPDLRKAIALCESRAGYVTRKLLSDILEDEEEHVDFLETRIDLIEKVGLGNFLQSQLSDSD